MQKRGIVAALVVLLALIAWTQRSEPPAATDDDPESPSGPLLPGLADADVLEVDVGPADKGVRLRKLGPLWVLAPSNRPAEAAIAQLAVRALTRTDSQRTLVGVAPSQEHGLGPDAIAVRVGTAEREHHLQLGGSAPVGAGRYVSVDGVLHLADPTALGVFERDPLDFRDRRPFPIDRDGALSITVGRSSGAVLLTRASADAPWRVGEDGPRADPAAVDTLLRGLAGLSARTWRALPEPRPEADVTFRIADADRSATLTLGPEDPDGDRPAWTEGALLPAALHTESAVVTASLLDSLPADDAWFDPRALPLEPATVTGFSWTAGGETWAVEARDGGWWRGEEALDPAGVTGFLDAVAALEADAPVDDTLAEGAVEVARLEVRTARGATAVELLRGPNVDLLRAPEEPGVREVDAAAFDLLGHLRPFEALP